MLKPVTKCQQKTPTNFPVWSFYGNILFFIAFGALRLQITQLLSIPNIRTLTFQLSTTDLCSTEKDIFLYTVVFSGKLIYSPLYPVIFLSLKKPLLLVMHKKFFRKQKHGKIHVLRDYMEDPLFAHVEVKTGKASSRL